MRQARPADTGKQDKREPCTHTVCCEDSKLVNK